MKLIILAIGTTGDVAPMITLGRHLQDQGVEVVLGSLCNFKTLIEKQGLQFRQLSGNIEEILQSDVGKAAVSHKGSIFELLSIVEIFKKNANEEAREIWEICQGADGIVYTTLLQNIVPSIAEKLGIPALPIYYQPMHPTKVFPSPLITKYSYCGSLFNKLSWSIYYTGCWFFLKKMINAWREKLVLPKLASRADYLRMLKKFQDFTIYPISPRLLNKPKDWGENIHLTGFVFPEKELFDEPSEELSLFLSKGEKPVYLGFGSNPADQIPKIYEDFVAYILKNGLRAVIATGWSKYVISPSESVLVVKSVPHDWLFKHVKAAIHHGGIGTTAAAVRAGIPSLTIPFYMDQPFWGNSLAQRGLGPKPLYVTKYNTHAFYDKLTDLLQNESYSIESKKLSFLIEEENGLQAAAEKIVEFMSKNRKF